MCGRGLIIYIGKPGSRIFVEGVSGGVFTVGYGGVTDLACLVNVAFSVLLRLAEMSLTIRVHFRCYTLTDNYCG